MDAQLISTPTEAPAEIKALIDKALDGFNRRNSAQYNSAFGADIVIVDGMAPYRWTGPNAQGRWFADAEKWAHHLGVADEKIAYDRSFARTSLTCTPTSFFRRTSPSRSKVSVPVGLVSSPSRWRSRATSGRSRRRLGAA
jgi:hypothetical protein